LLDDSEHLLHNHHASAASLRPLFTFTPECRSACLRNQRSPSPEYPQIGDGLIVASMGWSILLEKDEAHETARRSVTCSDALHSAFYPLTLPLTVGPGSISVAVTLGANSTRRYGFHIAIIVAALIAMTAVAISILLCYGLADQLARVIGKTGMIVIVRLSSFLLVCIGVQIMWNGLSALLATLHT